MSRFMRKLVRRNTGPDRPDSRGSGLTSSDVAAQRKDTLDRELDAFCDTARWNNEGDEYIHLPAIVDSAESSPEAARHAAVKIRRILSKSTPQQSYRQYNAIMLMRILLNNPGTPFSAGFDEKFVSAVKKVLRECQDVMVQSIMRETLEWMEKEKLWDMNLRALLEAWRKEKRETQKLYGRMAAMVSRYPRTCYQDVC
ncbi:hypothetical protein KEM55_007661 [Ascosphaera atra]|nr:hypothetical protein KEM55_007661 [Ascosphaera atra]